MKLLIVEDDDRLADKVKHLLTRLYTVDVAYSGETALSKVAMANYGMIILDLTLPDMQGLEVCRRLRDNDINTPILILSGAVDIPTRVALLNSGADDYLTKPYNPSELLARVGALVRRQPLLPRDRILLLDDLMIDVDERTVLRAGRPVALRRKEFDILEYLVQNKGRVLTRRMIIDHVWESNAMIWSGAVDVHIKHLRDKIDRPFRTHLIRTAYGVGYKADEAR